MNDVNVKDLLQSGIVEFSFKKADGSVREARGTLDFNHIPEKFHPKKEKLSESDNKTEKSEKQLSTQTYFDLDSQAWRAFKWENFISVKGFE